MLAEVVADGAAVAAAAGWPAVGGDVQATGESRGGDCLLMRIGEDFGGGGWRGGDGYGCDGDYGDCAFWSNSWAPVPAERRPGSCQPSCISLAYKLYTGFFSSCQRDNSSH